MNLHPLDPNFLSRLLDSLPNAICVFDEAWKPTYVNTQGSELLDRLAVFESSGNLSRLGTISTGDLQIAADAEPLKLVVDGPPAGILEAAVKSIPHTDPPGSHLVILRDVTQEQANYVRAKEQDRLAAMGQLAAGIAHDFNNVLTAMIGYADVMAMDPETTDKQKENLEIIASQGQRAEQLVRQVLDFSRQRTMRRVPLDVDDLLNEVARLMGQTLPEDVSIEHTIASAPLIARANAMQLQEVMTNLVVNARDAMPSGGTIELAAKRIEVPEDARLMTHSQVGPDAPPSGGSWIAIVVRDTGQGMPLEVQRRVFEPFYTTKPETKGTGLGLAQVYGIVRQHDGYVDLQSEVDVGTTFTIFLPATDDETVADTDTKAEITPGNGETVLVVEDDPVVLGVVIAMLEGIGYNAIAANGGERAIALLEEETKIDVLLTDVVMPGISGVELARRSRELRPDLPVMMMTGHTLDEREAIEQRAAVFLSKPLSLSELAAAVKSQIPD